MEMSDATAFSMLELQRLKKFYLVNEFGSHAVRFSNIFSPVVEKFGPQLTELELSQISDVSINRLRDLCVNLETLSLLWNTDYVRDDFNEPLMPYFKSLKSVKIFSAEIDPVGMGSEESNIPHNDLLSVIQSPELEDIQLLNCHNLFAETIQHALVYSKFIKLKNFKLERCNRITYDGLRYGQSGNRLDLIALKIVGS